MQFRSGEERAGIFVTLALNRFASLRVFAVFARGSVAQRRQIALASEGTYKSAALAVNRPRHAKIRTLVLIEFRHRRHRMVHLSQRLVVDVFVSAHVVLL